MGIFFVHDSSKALKPHNGPVDLENQQQHTTLPNNQTPPAQDARENSFETATGMHHLPDSFSGNIDDLEMIALSPQKVNGEHSMPSTTIGEAFYVQNSLENVVEQYQSPNSSPQSAGSTFLAMLDRCAKGKAACKSNG